jgi:hypothetical protein
MRDRTKSPLYFSKTLNIEDSILSLPKDNELNCLLSPFLRTSEKKQMSLQLLEADQFPLTLPLLNFPSIEDHPLPMSCCRVEAPTRYHLDPDEIATVKLNKRKQALFSSDNLKQASLETNCSVKRRRNYTSTY